MTPSKAFLDELLLTQDKLYPFCRKWLKGYSEDVHKDLFQQTILESLEYWDRWNPTKSNLYTWLCSIAKHKILTFIRDNNRKGLVNLDEGLTQQSLPNLGLDSPYLKDLVNFGLKKLPIIQRVILIKSSKGASVSDIAYLLDKDPLYIKATLHTARANFGGLINPYIDGYEVRGKGGSIFLSDIPNPRSLPILPPGQYGQLRGAEDMITSAYGYIREIYNKLCFGQSIGVHKLGMNKISERHHLNHNFRRFLNHFYLKTEKRRYSWKDLSVLPQKGDILAIFEDFKTYDMQVSLRYAENHQDTIKIKSHIQRVSKRQKMRRRQLEIYYKTR